ncbi:MAG: hypothetical protein LBD97_00775 [Bifidobacteriaceae bacterium]|jgi:hypothetical protein|nr:hypothetical protein [Bifidobacteriaceae bacterium]
MTTKIQEVTIDCADAARLAEFWGTLLERPWGYQPAPGLSCPKAPLPEPITGRAAGTAQP